MFQGKKQKEQPNRISNFSTTASTLNNMNTITSSSTQDQETENKFTRETEDRIQKVYRIKKVNNRDIQKFNEKKPPSSTVNYYADAKRVIQNRNKKSQKRIFINASTGEIPEKEFKIGELDISVIQKDQNEDFMDFKEFINLI